MAVSDENGDRWQQLYSALHQVLEATYKATPTQGYRCPVVSRDDCTATCKHGKSNNMVTTPGQCTGDCCSSCNWVRNSFCSD